MTPKTASVMVVYFCHVAVQERLCKLSAFGPAFTTYLVTFVLLQSLVVESVVARDTSSQEAVKGGAWRCCHSSWDV